MRMVHPAHAATKFFPHLLPGCWANWICVVNFLPLAPPTSPHSTSRLYIVMMSQFYKSIFSAEGHFFKSKTSMDQKFYNRFSHNQPCLQFFVSCQRFYRHRFSHGGLQRKWFLGHKGIFCCTTVTGHRAGLEAKLNGILISRLKSVLTSGFCPQRECVQWSFNPSSIDSAAVTSINRFR